VACLFERECSLQRRHQKLIEEAPSAVMADPLWQEMRIAVRRLISASGYVGAGTVEFMFDEPTGKFYFLEVNARLQVEHPVTEAITGLDLVKWQLRIASGEELDVPNRLLQGDRSAIVGHAIEARIVAEDPGAGFMPSSGKILAWAQPLQPGIRVDTGYGPGTEVPRYYDSLLAKVIAHGETRAQAIEKLKSALLDFHILGVKTNISYVLAILDHADFVAGHFDTGWLAREFAEWRPQTDLPLELGAIVAQAGVSTTSVGAARVESTGAWALADSFRNTR
jgi:3-methylcrotonyl-CoA carboxylase alpha subunit